MEMAVERFGQKRSTALKFNTKMKYCETSQQYRHIEADHRRSNNFDRSTVFEGYEECQLISFLYYVLLGGTPRTSQ